MATSLAQTTTQVAQRAARTTPFRLGQKEVYLPDFTVKLRRSNQPPQYATFEVPLSMNKLDLRDYLFHAYSIRTLSVSSRILPLPVQDTKPDQERPVRTLYRPAPQKLMTVLMDKPFVWPSPPSKKSLKDDFNQDQFQSARKEQEKMSLSMRDKDAYKDVDEREMMRDQARRLLAGKDKWRPMKRSEGSWAVRKAEEGV